MLVFVCLFVFQSAHINDVEGGAGTGISFDSLPQVGNVGYTIDGT